MIGDHLRTLRAGRWTHAIDCGDETVLVLGEEDGQASRVRRSYRPDFVAGADAVEVVLHRERTFPAPEVVARAYSRIADPALASMFRDSEAFAEWCVTGRLPAGPRNVAVEVPAVSARAATPAPAAPSARRAPEGAAPAKAARPAKKKAAAPAKAKPSRAVKATPSRAKAVTSRPGRARAAKARPARKAAPRSASRAAARKPSKRRGRR